MTGSKTSALRLISLKAIAALLAVAGAILLYAGGAARGEPVEGVKQAYRATPPPASDPPVYEYNQHFYFKGVTGDQANKIAGAPTATFSPGEPTGPTVNQIGNWAGFPDEPGQDVAVYWVADFTGTIDGPVRIEWWWSSANAEAHLFGLDVDVRFFADPDVDGNWTIIGSADQVTLDVAAQATRSTSIVNVKGTVTSKLMVQALPTFVDTGNDATVYYNSPDFPSRFSIPTLISGDPNPPPPQNFAVPYDRALLELQSVYTDTQALEPTIGVTKNGTAFYAAAGWQIDTPVVKAGAATKVLRSTDGGLSWEAVSPNFVATEDPPITLDPYVYVDTATGRVFSIDLALACSYLHWSDDGGETWSTNPTACGGGELINDHQTIVAGPPPANVETNGYPNVLYYCVNRVFDVSCSRSLDGGASFDQLSTRPFQGDDPDAGGFCGGLHGHLVTDKEGRVFLPKGHCRFPWIAVSEDAGDSWTRVQVSDTVPSTVGSGSGIQTSVAVDEAGNLYYVWWDRPNEKHRLPYMAVSQDHGKTWSDPLMIAPPGVVEVNFPTIDAGAEGRVTVAFPGTTVAETEENADSRPWNYYVVVSDTALDPNPIFLSATANEVADPIHRGECQDRCGAMFDFIDVLVAPAGEVWSSTADSCTQERDCISTTEGNAQAFSFEGMAIRQLAGPALRGPRGDLPSPAATGRSSAVTLAGVVLLLLGVVMLLRLQRTARTRGP